MDVITLSDDEVECIKQVINLTPIIVDLTDDPESEPSAPTDDSESEPSAPTADEHTTDNDLPTAQEDPVKEKYKENLLSEANRTYKSDFTNKPDPEPPEPPQPPKPPESSVPPVPPVPLAPPVQPVKRIITDHELLALKKEQANEKYRKNLLSDAIRTYKEAGELAKRLDDKEMSATIHFNLAMTYDRLGSYAQAADECSFAVKIKDDYMKPQLKRAEIYERLNKFDEAVICWEHICELDPSNRDYAIRLNRVKGAAKVSSKKDPLELLGLNATSFTRDDLRKAYKKKALSHHPDRHPDADIVTRRIQEKLFKDASEAHSYVQLRYGYK